LYKSSCLTPYLFAVDTRIAFNISFEGIRFSITNGRIEYNISLLAVSNFCKYSLFSRLLKKYLVTKKTIRELIIPPPIPVTQGLFSISVIFCIIGLFKMLHNLFIDATFTHFYTLSGEIGAIYFKFLIPNILENIPN
jgi:hypothetical protein